MFRDTGMVGLQSLSKSNITMSPNYTKQEECQKTRRFYN